MNEILVKINGDWCSLSLYNSYEALGIDDYTAIEVDGLPDGLDLESDFDALKAYDGMAEDDQQIVMAYYKATNVFNPEEAMEAYQGSYYTGADFARELCEEIDSEALEALPTYLRDCIKWSDVWDYYLRFDYFESGNFYFRNI